jgi:hypothetical protein
MYSKVLEHLLSVLLACAWLLSGCAGAPLIDGQVLALQPTTTLVGVYSALSGTNPLAHALQNGSLTVIAWPQSGGWAWVCLRCTARDPVDLFVWLTGGRGNLANASTFSGLADYLKSKGWVEVTPTLVAAGQSVGSFLNQMAGSMTSFMVLPVIVPVATEGPQT